MPSVRIGTGVGERNCLSKVAGVEGFFGSKNIEIVLILVLENDGVSNGGRGIFPVCNSINNYSCRI